MLTEFIIKYWVEVLFGLICAGCAALARRYVKLSKEEKERQQKKMIETLEHKMDEQNNGMAKQMAESYDKLLEVVKDSEERSMAEDRQIYAKIDNLTGGVLSIEGRAFKDDCRKLLDPAHIITLAEFEAIQAEHIVYNNLGGNHEGDGLYSMVVAKYQNALTANSAE